VSPFKVDFASIEWCEGRPGVRFKTYREGSRQVRLVEFSTGEGDPHWCELGHIGFVLQGGLKIDFKGTVLAFDAGDCLFIPPGASSAHRSVSILPGTRLFMVEEQSIDGG
jgi:quercetin dioxygenase-like cupin family protein